MLVVCEIPRDDYNDLIFSIRIRSSCVILHGTSPAKLVTQYSRHDETAIILLRFNVETFVLRNILLHLLRNKP